MATFRERIEPLMAGKTQRESAKMLGIPLNTYTAWLRGERTPSYEALIKICTVLGVNSDYLLGLSATPNPTAPDSTPENFGIPVSGATRIPVVGMAAAMHYEPSLGVIGELWAGSDETVACVIDHTEGLFAVRISGDSMAPTLLDGDIIAVRDVLPATGDLCLALHRTDGLICKRWYWRNGTIKLTSDNAENGKSYVWTKAEYQSEQPLVWRWRVEGLIWRKFN